MTPRRPKGLPISRLPDLVVRDRHRVEGITATLPGASAPRQLGGAVPLTSVLKQIFGGELPQLEAGEARRAG